MCIKRSDLELLHAADIWAQYCYSDDMVLGEFAIANGYEIHHPQSLMFVNRCEAKAFKASYLDYICR